MALDTVRLSKFLSLVLRHEPGKIGLALDTQGWAVIEDLITRATAAGTAFSRADLERVVATSDKKRFTISEDGQRIRAAQGHSVSVELGLTPREPPPVLYHGTATRFVHAIMAQGLTPQSRQHVHLSPDEATARNVGRRHGKPIVFRVDASAMYRAGIVFYVADNGVWLTDHVPPDYLTVSAAS